jgi:hypothetical protein
VLRSAAADVAPGMCVCVWFNPLAAACARAAVHALRVHQ